MTIEAMAPHAASDTAACLYCDQPVHSTGSGKTWVHTGTGSFVCRNRDGIPQGHWAEPCNVDTREEAEQKAFEEGVADCRESHESIEQAEREEYHAELSSKVETLCGDWERRFVGDDEVPGQGLITEFIDQLRGVFEL